MQRINGIEVLTTVEELVVPTQTAVIVIDMQNYAISAQGGPARAGEDISQLVAMAPRLQNLLHSAREAGVLVTYAEHIMQNSLGANLSAAPMLYQLQLRPVRYVTHVVEGTWEAQTIDELAPQVGDVVVRKATAHGGSALYKTVLDDVFRMRGITSLIVAGQVTDGCVLRTAVDALQYSYYPIIVRECVGSMFQQSHKAALAWMETRFPMFDLDEVLTTWDV